LSADFTENEKQILQGAENAAYIGAVLNYRQDAPVDHAQFYRGDAAWMGLFDVQGQYFKTADTFKAAGQMLPSPKRLPVTGTDTIAGRSLDGNTVKIFISNYAIPAGYKPHSFGMPPEIQQLGPPPPDFSKVRSLPSRTDVVYRNNSSHNLTVRNLPWDHSAFTVKRFRISKSQNLDLVEEKSGRGSTLHLANPLIPGTVELIVVQRK
jgi:hypothetical protein